MREQVTLNRKEQKRAMVLTTVIEGGVTVQQAGEVLGLSVRHVRRLKAAYMREGPAALAHGNRGRRPAHALEDALRRRVVELAQTTYGGCNHQHLTELLAEREGIHLSRSSVRRILSRAGLRSPRRRRPPKHRSRRERMPRAGMLLQVDGSRHRWLEERGPWLTLVGAVDDATGEVPYALFREQEDAAGYLLLLREVVRTHGVPLALYSDRHSIFQGRPEERETLEEQLAGRREPTQVGKVLEELGIQSILARSPQAKGRVERLWGTFQDRLVTELRLADARTLGEANQVLWAFLPRFNARFSRPPEANGSAYRPLGTGFDPDACFSFKYRRIVSNDNLVRLDGQLISIPSGHPARSYARALVEVQERLDGSLVVYYQGRCIARQEPPVEPRPLRTRSRRRGLDIGTIRPPSPKQLAQARPAPATPSQPRRPAEDHPWRRWMVTKLQTT
jgi:transposase